MKMCSSFRSLVMASFVALTVTACSSETESVDASAAPENITWNLGPAGLEYPVSSVSGPHVTDPVPSGFSNDPQGAVLAAMATQVFLAAADDESWPLVAQKMLEPGIGRDQWAQARALLSVKGKIENPPQFKAFRVDDFSEGKAIISLAAFYPKENLTAAMPVQLSHSSGDWRVVLPPQDQAPDLVELGEETLKTFTSLSKE